MSNVQRQPLEAQREADINNEGRPQLVHRRSQMARRKSRRFNGVIKIPDVTKHSSSYTARRSPTTPNELKTTISSDRDSINTCEDSPPPSRPDSPFSTRLMSVPSSATSANITLDLSLERKLSQRSRVSIFSRLRSSISTSEKSSTTSKRPSIQPSDFGNPSEQSEKQFIDSIGMVIPGVGNRQRCTHPLSHFVINWRLCEPIEYTTALADHGITFSDHSLLLSALENFLDDIPSEPRRRNKYRLRCAFSAEDQSPARLLPSYTVTESTHQSEIAEEQVVLLDKLLEEISWNWQAKGIPVMVCVSSYALFTPNRISESIVQIVHVSKNFSPSSTGSRPRVAARLSFIEFCSTEDKGERSVAMPRNKFNRSASPTSGPSSPKSPIRYQPYQLRDRSQPWPLWPNAIPSIKRELMNDNADRYGVDPYFRAWMRANINSRTKSTSYAKYMIEKEDNPFINKRLEYLTPPSRRSFLTWRSLITRPRKWKDYSTSMVNRETYEHNFRLEVRKTVELGSRLRLVRFGFRNPIYPPHTPELDELGLSKDSYHGIIRDIEDIRRNSPRKVEACLPTFLASWNRIRRRCRRAEDALPKVSEYIKKINAADSRIVWTIEEIPGVYDSGLGRSEKEWEISAWNGEEPLELLIQLEKWGIIEKRLHIDDDE